MMRLDQDMVSLNRYPIIHLGPGVQHMSSDCILPHKDNIMKTIHTDPQTHEATRKPAQRKRAHSPKRFLCIPYDVNSAKVLRR